MNDNILAVGITIVKTSASKRLDKMEAPTLEDKARVCFEEALSEDCTWFSTSEDDKFRIGCLALLILSEGTDKERIENTLRALQALGAAQRGVPVNFSALPDDPEEVVPLLPWFRSVLGDKKP